MRSHANSIVAVHKSLTRITFHFWIESSDMVPRNSMSFTLVTRWSGHFLSWIWLSASSYTQPASAATCIEETLSLESQHPSNSEDRNIITVKLSKDKKTLLQIDQRKLPWNGQVFYCSCSTCILIIESSQCKPPRLEKLSAVCQLLFGVDKGALRKTGDATAVFSDASCV